ncbi:MAG: cob(I)yrinic acid a,c-diamide adenosyltransferase [Gammaproteobacteria bacterium]|nr:cob(I)yrinic acid a,c-diamide adenosyltransferase [Gammaproteobacteria bacterium]
MRYRLTKIYTRAGDFGMTRLGDKSKIEKDHPRVECYGTIDELNSAMGLILSEPNLPPQIVTWLTEVQHRLFDIGGELATPGLTVITADCVTHLEKNMDSLNQNLPPLKEFILPKGPFSSAACHLARTICRRAERRCVTLSKIEKINPEILKYINRLSDFLFVISRTLARHLGKPEILWEPLTNH